MARPAETLAGALGALIAAVVAVAAALGYTVPPAVITALTAVVGFVAAAVTWYVARRQRDPADDLTAKPDGSVVSQ